MALRTDLALRADRPAVIDEVFDGEAVLVHLGTGRYYALNGPASELWALIGPGLAPGTVLAAVRAARGEQAAADAEEFLERLVAEGLLVPGEAAQEPVPESPGRGPWGQAPELQCFEDLQDLLLVDPIHDVTVGPDGWPVPAAG